MSRISFQAVVFLETAVLLQTGDWTIRVKFTDNEGVSSGLDVTPGDVLAFDTSSYETGTMTFYDVVEVQIPSASTPTLRVAYSTTNDNASGSPDLQYVLGSSGVIARPSTNRNLLPVVSQDTQLIVDKFVSYLQNYNMAVVLDKLQGATGPVRYTEVIGNTTDIAYTITHNLGTRDVLCNVRDAATDEFVFVDIAPTSPDTVRVSFAFPPGNNSYRVVVIG